MFTPSQSKFLSFFILNNFLRREDDMDPINVNPELSLGEKERRWSLVREKMRKEGLAAVVIYGDTRVWTSVRYLANVFPTGLTQVMLLFPADGYPIFLTTHTRNKFFTQQNLWIQPENVYLSSTLGSDLAKQLIALNLHNKRVGIDSYKTWPTQDYQILRDLCPDLELIEASRLLSEIRGPKSSEELKLIEEAIRINELAQRTFLANLKPGMKEEEVVGKVEDVIRANGIDSRLWLISSSPEMAYPDRPGKTIIQKPNPVTFSAEFVRTGGYASQTVRTYCWEEPKGDYKRMWELWKELRRMVLKEFRPGRQVAELVIKVKDMVNGWGFECDVFGHATGLDMSDAPYISTGPRGPNHVEWTIMPNEVYSFHPRIRTKGGGPPMAWAGDMYLIGEDSTKWMTPYLPGLPEMIPE